MAKVLWTFSDFSFRNAK